MTRKRTADATEAAWLAARDARNAEAKATPVAEVKQLLNQPDHPPQPQRRVPVKNALLKG